FFSHRLDENIDAPVATEAQSRVEVDPDRRPVSHHFQSAPRYFFFETSATQGTGRRSVRANQHPRARPAITRSFRAHQRRQRHQLSTMALKNAKNISYFFHPGSARASRAGFGAVAETIFDAVPKKVRDGGAPSPAREARALPGFTRTVIKSTCPA